MTGSSPALAKLGLRMRMQRFIWFGWDLLPSNENHHDSEKAKFDSSSFKIDYYPFYRTMSHQLRGMHKYLVVSQGMACLSWMHTKIQALSQAQI